MRYTGAGSRIHAIGLARDTRKFVNCIIGVDLLHDIRSRLIYSPATLIHLSKLSCIFYDSEEIATAEKREIQADANWARSRRSGRFGHLE